MTDPSEMTAAELAAVHAAIEAQDVVRMVRPDGRTVSVAGPRVQERLDADYRLADEEG